MPDNQSAVPVSQRAREYAASVVPITSLRRDIRKGLRDDHVSVQAFARFERDCTAEVDALRAERDRLRAFTIYVSETPEDASGHPSIVADLKLKARELLK